MGNCTGIFKRNHNNHPYILLFFLKIFDPAPPAFLLYEVSLLRKRSGEYVRVLNETDYSNSYSSGDFYPTVIGRLLHGIKA